MRYLPLVCLLLASLAWGQQAPPQSGLPPKYRPPMAGNHDEPKTLSASAAAVPPETIVITIKGVCPQMAPSTESATDPSCQTEITRTQFERLTEAILPRMKPSMQKEVANAYPDLLAMAREAEARGVENSSRFQERLAFARKQILSQELVREIDEESAKISDRDIEDYYHNHPALFEQATLDRIFIPNHERIDSSSTDRDTATPDKEMATADKDKAAGNTQQKEAGDAMIRIAEQLRARAVTGEDFLKLQKEAYAAANFTDVPPNPSLGQVHPGSLPPGHAAAFDLRPGEVSQILSDSSGHYIYKCHARKVETLDEAKRQIQKRLQNQHREKAIQAVQGPVTAEFNPAYFGSTEKHTAAPSSTKSE